MDRPLLRRAAAFFLPDGSTVTVAESPSGKDVSSAPSTD